MTIGGIVRALAKRRMEFMLGDRMEVLVHGYEAYGDLKPAIRAARRGVERWTWSREFMAPKLVRSGLRARSVWVAGRYTHVTGVRRGDVYTLEELALIEGMQPKGLKVVDRVKDMLDGMVVV